MKFLSPKEIVKDFSTDLSNIDIEILCSMEREELIGFHHSVGMHIRNKYLLWDKKNPYTDGDDPIGDKHPDQVSQQIIEDIYDLFHK